MLAVFREAGVATVDADEIAREVVRPGSDGLAAIVEAFGADVLLSDGSLDRKRVAAIVFDDVDRRRTLNRIVHPRVGVATQARLLELETKGYSLGCYDAALLVESGLVEAFRPLVVVAAPRLLQRARLVARDGLSEREADARLDSQAPLDEKLAAADVVIWNDADLDTLRERARSALGEVKQKIAAV